MTSNIIMTDEDPEGKLKNFCYDFCDDDSTQDIKTARGLVYKDDKPFLKSFGYTPQYVIENMYPQVKDYIETNIKNFKFFDSYEGTLLRLFYNDINDKWYLSTHRKLNADKSKWGSSETFGDKFKSIVPENFYTNLNKEYHYMFLLTPNENNRIVCKTTNMILHIGTFDKDFNLSTDYNIGIPRPTQHKFDSWNELVDFIENKVDINKTQGIIVQDTYRNSNIKLLNSVYNAYSLVRNNVPSIKFRYLQIRQDDNMKLKMRELYPSHIKFFEEYENILWNIADKLFQAYVNRFIRKIYTTVSPEENVIIKKCHAWHLLNKQTNKMSKERVMKVIDDTDAVILNKLIKINKN